MCLVSFLAPRGRLTLLTFTSCLLCCVTIHIYPDLHCIVLLAERAYRRRYPGAKLHFPGHPGIWSWDHISSEGEKMAKITGHIRFRVHEPQGCVGDDVI